MQKKIFIYLFAFTALILIFQLVNSSKVVTYQVGVIEKKINENDFLQARLDTLEQAYFDDVYFTLEPNQQTYAYFNDTDIPALTERIKDALYAYNVKKGKNTLIPYAQMEGKFLFNKVKLLNHKWIIADFSDGNIWGEVLLQYDVNKGGSISFTTLSHFLYPND